MHYPTDRITHTTAFVTPVVEHWLDHNKSSITISWPTLFNCQIIEVLFSHIKNIFSSMVFRSFVIVYSKYNSFCCLCHHSNSSSQHNRRLQQFHQHNNNNSSSSSNNNSSLQPPSQNPRERYKYCLFTLIFV